MKKANRLLILPLIGILILLMACNLPQKKNGDLTGEALNTSIAQTVNAAQTQTVSGTMVAPTGTPQPTLLPTFTAPAGSTQPAAPTRPAPTATQPICNWARFVDDVSVPDNSPMMPGQVFTKTWRLLNAGSCAWTLDYAIVFSDGDGMGAPAAISFPKIVQPGQTVDLSVQMTAPGTPGTYKGNWKLRSNTGQVFGLGQSGTTSFWVQIVVGQPAATINPDARLDFAASMCSARWSSDKGAVACPSTLNYQTGSVFLNNAPKLELSYQDDEPAIIMAPSAGANGIISGRYPAVNVRAGDKFGALVGCVSGAQQCNVTIQVNYIANGGAVQSLGTWQEKYDGEWTRINVDLGSLANQSVEFILQVGSNGSSDGDQVFWLSPTIVR